MTHIIRFIMKSLLKARIVRCSNGATAVEFAFFAIPMAFIMVGMVEIGMMSTAGTILQGATDDAARLVRTGQAQQSADPEGLFADLLCDRVNLIIDCDNIQYEAIKIDESDGFGGVAANMVIVEPIYDINGNYQPRGFDPGKENSLIIIRVVYPYPLMSPFTAPFLAESGKTTRTLMATAIIENEPYEF